MTRRNNFDQNSTGLNIECTCFYDTSLSRMQFEESIKIIQPESYYKKTIAYYIDNGNVEDDDAITFELQGTEEQIENALLKEGYNRDEYKAMIIGEPLSILETGYGEKITLLNYEDFNKVYEPLSVKPSKTLQKIITRGYSQGDYAEVFYCPEDLEKAWGNAPEENSLKKTIDHLFWDTPIYAVFTINEEEYAYHDQPDYDEYEWDRDKFLKYVAEKSGVAIEKLEPLLPDHPSC